VPPVLCDYCESSNHNVHNYPYREYFDAMGVSFGKTMNELFDKIIENMK